MMKILLLGEYSNVHATLAKGLRTLGHQVTVASNGDFWKNYPRDIDLARKEGRWGGIRLMMKLMRELPKMRGYDVVQLINPLFFELKAENLRPIYDYLRRNNKKVFLGAFGMDWYWVKVNTEDKPLRYSDFNIGNEVRMNADAVRERTDWLDTPKGELSKYIANDCDGIIAGLYEYWVCYQPLFPDKTCFIPFPIEIPSPKPVPTFQSPVKLFIGINRSRNEYKGTDIMLKAAEEIVARYPDKLELRKAVSLPFNEYKQMMKGCDAILDQLYSYTPSMNPLQAMSEGIICIGGGEPENYDIINEKQLRPIINVQPTYESVVNELKKLALHPERILQLKRESVEYVCRHHDHLKVARQYLDFYCRA